jgi:hypothetical protein
MFAATSLQVCNFADSATLKMQAVFVSAKFFELLSHYTE